MLTKKDPGDARRDGDRAHREAREALNVTDGLKDAVFSIKEDLRCLKYEFKMLTVLAQQEDIEIQERAVELVAAPDESALQDIRDRVSGLEKKYENCDAALDTVRPTASDIVCRCEDYMPRKEFDEYREQVIEPELKKLDELEEKYATNKRVDEPEEKLSKMASADDLRKLKRAVSKLQ